jgi:hypothetical protein
MAYLRLIGMPWHLASACLCHSVEVYASNVGAIAQLQAWRRDAVSTRGLQEGAICFSKPSKYVTLDLMHAAWAKCMLGTTL